MADPHDQDDGDGGSRWSQTVNAGEGKRRPGDGDLTKGELSTASSLAAMHASQVLETSTPESPKELGMMVVADRNGPELSGRVSSLVGFFDHGVGEQGVIARDEAANLDLDEARTLQPRDVERPITFTEKISLILDSIPRVRILPHLIRDPKLKLRDHRKIDTLDSLSIKYTTFSKTNTKSLPKVPLSITSRRTISIQDTPLETQRPTTRKPKRITSPFPNTIPSLTQHSQTYLYLSCPVIPLPILPRPRNGSR